jgi:hypothetical protein
MSVRGNCGAQRALDGIGRSDSKGGSVESVSTSSVFCTASVRKAASERLGQALNWPTISLHEQALA